MSSDGAYRLVRLANGAHSVHSLAYGETCHPTVGPEAEAQALYVRQLKVLERLRSDPGEFVVWDVGLGAGANALTLLRVARHVAGDLRLVSFDNTLDPLCFALNHTDVLNYLQGYEERLMQLIQSRRVQFLNGSQRVHWDAHIEDFPSLLNRPAAQAIPKPRAILFDPFSPMKNPAMWTAPLFASLFQLLDPTTPCALATYSRSTMLRVALLLAGFFVGAGDAIGSKEETTVAANVPHLIETPLGKRWLQRARQSASAEPLWEPVYRTAKLTDETWNRLSQCLQLQ